MARHFERSFRLKPSATERWESPRPRYLRVMRFYGRAALAIGPLIFLLFVPLALYAPGLALILGGLKYVVSGVLIWLVLSALADIVEGVQDIREAVGGKEDGAGDA
ncbi:hypothetical protein HN371_27270 [Candidatus Poribacteria bacterium]|jgi:hypothetical protein|nr:hypothetical protein [Candidatus Poribacteria bacterium]MBT5534788.1 hypothetical protein [Candidatus Poribacteria bacterium]MBT5715119.1 hypothetical protein [Candidatus Poribacteria bacterium]MBT7098187.1 hypothetical protein [Candidatus Poribacteria bacterium]MBT7809075.1 hypothetical protein [Candidatus Poribacteria bacterium]